MILRQGRGFSLIEVMMAMAILSIVTAALLQMMSSMQHENRSISDNAELVSTQHQLEAFMADDALCACQLRGLGAMTPDPRPATGTAAAAVVEMTKITTNCQDQTKVFAAVGSRLAGTLSPSFLVNRISLRDLRPTGRRNGATNAYDEYTGAFYVEFDPKVNPSRSLRGMRVGKIFSTTPDGTKLTSCAAANDFYQGPMVTNSGSSVPTSSVARCPTGYSVISGGYRMGRTPAACGAPTVVTESRPFTAPGAVQGWMISVRCAQAQAVAVCGRGH